MTLGMRSYVSQLGPDGLGHDRCAPACLASYLLDRGWESDPWLLLQELAAPGAPLAADRVHDASDLIEAARGKGFTGHRWLQWPIAQAALTRPEWGLFALVDNGVLRPTAYPNVPGWRALHWIRLVQLVGDDGDLVVTYDPLTHLPQPGGPVYHGPMLYTVQSVRSAIMATPVEYAGVLVKPLPAAAPPAEGSPA